MARKPNAGTVDEIGSARNNPDALVKQSSVKGLQKDTKPREPKRSAFLATVALVMSVALMVFFPFTLMVIFFGMLPSGFALMVDSHPKRYTTKTVAWANFAGTVIVAMSLWQTDRSWDSTIDILANPVNWIIMMGAAAIGYGIQAVVPKLVYQYLNMTLALRRRALESRMRNLEKEWGTDIRHEAVYEELEDLRQIVHEGEATPDDLKSEGEGTTNPDTDSQNTEKPASV